jgi:DNA-binding CsgD family transcriptional regulator/tetratricopeptide (TPR) repeat protein
MALLERERELVVLDEALRDARRGTGRIVVVRGEAGIGKTALVTEFASRIDARTPVAWGSCDPVPRPLGAILETAEALGIDIPRDDRGTTSSRFLDGIRAAPRAPVVIVEDIHWADEATLECLAYLGRRVHRTSALVLVTTRDDEIPAGHPVRIMLGDLLSAAGARIVEPRRLSRSAVERLVGDGAAGRRVWEVAGGNPFLTSELRGAAGNEIPVTLRDAAAARMARLSAAGRTAAEVAAVAGQRCEAWLLERMLAAEAEAVDECIDHGLLIASDDRLSFRHELARLAVLEGISPPRRISIHRRLFDILEATPASRGDTARLVHHAIGAADHDAVLRLAPKAAVEAAQRSSHREAAQHYRRALDVAGVLGDAERAALLESYAVECHMTDDRDAAISALEEVVSLHRTRGDRLRTADGLVRMTTVLFRAGRTDDAEEAARAALTEIDGLPLTGTHVRVYRAHAYLRMLTRNSQEAIAWARRALDAAAEIGETDVADIRNALGSALVVAGDIDEGERELGAAVALAHTRADPLQEALAASNLGSALGEMGFPHRARPHLEWSIRLGEDHDVGAAESYASAWYALTDLSLGLWTAAAERAGEILSRPSSPPIAVVMARICLGRLAARRGDADVWMHLDAALELADQTRTLQRQAPVRAARAEAAWLEGDLDRTRAEAEAQFARAVAHGHLPFTAELGFWLTQSGVEVTLPQDPADGYGLLARGRWSEAAGVWADRGGVYERALAQSFGDEHARRDALGMLDELGALPLARRVRRSLREAGVRGIPRAPGTARRAAAGLTARELEVLRLLAEGMSNAAIARRLMISARTVDHHVSAVLAKTGTSARGEAVAKALQEGVVSLGRESDPGEAGQREEWVVSPIRGAPPGS